MLEQPLPEITRKFVWGEQRLSNIDRAFTSLGRREVVYRGAEVISKPIIGGIERTFVIPFSVEQRTRIEERNEALRTRLPLAQVLELIEVGPQSGFTIELKVASSMGHRVYTLEFRSPEGTTLRIPSRGKASYLHKGKEVDNIISASVEVLEGQHPLRVDILDSAMQLIGETLRARIIAEPMSPAEEQVMRDAERI